MKKRFMHGAVMILVLSTAGMAQTTFSPPTSSPVNSTRPTGVAPTFTRPQTQAPTRQAPTSISVPFTTPQRPTVQSTRPTFTNPTFQKPTVSGGGGRVHHSSGHRYIPVSVTRASSTSAGQAQTRFKTAFKTLANSR